MIRGFEEWFATIMRKLSVVSVARKQLMVIEKLKVLSQEDLSVIVALIKYCEVST